MSKSNFVSVADMADHQMQNDDAHPYRVMRGIAVAMTPLWAILMITGFILQSLVWSLIALLLYLPPAVVYLHRVAFTGVCPQCKKRIAFSSVQDRYAAGDEYTYRCGECEIIWRTHLRPGTFVD